MSYLLIFFTGLVASVALLFFLHREAATHNVLTRNGMPYAGGIAIGLSFLAIYAVFFPESGLPLKQAVGIIASSSIILISGVIDDSIELSVAMKFLSQLVASAVLVFCGIRTDIVYIGDVGNILITLVWVIGITNALNHLDVLDGLAAGTTLISSLAFFGVAMMNGDPRSAVLSLLLMAATLPFLLYNLPPARMYMGNTGSHFLGFLMAACALLISYAPLDRGVALLTPLLVLGLPVFDTAFLIFVRLKQGRSAFQKSDDHMALRYLKQGYSKRKALAFILLFGLFLSLCALLVSQVPNLYAVLIFALACAVCLLVAQRMNRVC